MGGGEGVVFWCRVEVNIMDVLFIFLIFILLITPILEREAFWGILGGGLVVPHPVFSTPQRVPCLTNWFRSKEGLLLFIGGEGEGAAF